MAGGSTTQRRCRHRATPTARAPGRRRTAAAAATAPAGNGQPGRRPRLPARLRVRQQRRRDRDGDGRLIFHETQQEEAEVSPARARTRFTVCKRSWELEHFVKWVLSRLIHTMHDISDSVSLRSRSRSPGAESRSRHHQLPPELLRHLEYGLVDPSPAVAMRGEIPYTNVETSYTRPALQPRSN